MHCPYTKVFFVRTYVAATNADPTSSASLKAFAVGNVVQQCNSSLQVPIPSASPMRFSRSQDMGNHYSKGISNYRLGDVQDSGSSSNVPDRKPPTC